jgi:hypothetical protein
MAGGSGTLHRGFMLVSLTMLLGGFLWLAGAPFLQADTDRAVGDAPETRGES